MDSTSLLLHLIHKNFAVYTLSFNYGQKHILELEKASNNIKYLNTKGFDVFHKILDISDSASLLQSSLTDKNSNIPKGYYEEENMKSTVVPNRNSIFLSFLYGYSLSLYKKYNKEITLSLGVHSGDHAIYPDCRLDFYNKIFEAFRIGNWDSENLELYLPYIELNKKDILQNAISICDEMCLDFNKIFKNTLTSYHPDEKGRSDGETGSDIERILAFGELGIKDPIEYKKTWKTTLNNAKQIEEKYNNITSKNES